VSIQAPNTKPQAELESVAIIEGYCSIKITETLCLRGAFYHPSLCPSVYSYVLCTHECLRLLKQSDDCNQVSVEKTSPSLMLRILLKRGEEEAEPIRDVQKRKRGE